MVRRYPELVDFILIGGVPVIPNERFEDSVIDLPSIKRSFERIQSFRY